jgi:hypothetical protein
MISSQPGNVSQISACSDGLTCKGEQRSRTAVLRYYHQFVTEPGRSDREMDAETSLGRVVRGEALTDVVFGMKVRMHLESLGDGIKSSLQPSFGCDLCAC